jgi:hypothetical protein
MIIILTVSLLLNVVLIYTSYIYRKESLCKDETLTYLRERLKRRNSYSTKCNTFKNKKK